MKARRVVFANQKGGVGKTTLCRELGIYLASCGQQVLLVDSDPQGNLTGSLVEQAGEGGLYEALTGEEVQLLQLEPALWLLSGDGRLAVLEKHLIGELDAYLRLRQLLEDGRFERFDLILIDSPPSLGILSVNGLVASRHLVIPMNPSLYSLQGTNDLLETVSKVRATLNPELALAGVIINAFDRVPVITRQIREEIQEAFGEQVFSTVLSKSIKLEEAIATRRGVIHHRHLERSRAGQEVAALGEELLSRLDGTEGVSHGGS
jgi:chromosome partitioning protein